MIISLRIRWNPSTDIQQRLLPIACSLQRILCTERAKNDVPIVGLSIRLWHCRVSSMIPFNSCRYNAWHAFKFHELIMMELFCYSIRYEHAKRHYVLIRNNVNYKRYAARSPFHETTYYNIYYKQFTFFTIVLVLLEHFIENYFFMTAQICWSSFFSLLCRE